MRLHDRKTLVVNVNRSVLSTESYVVAGNGLRAISFMQTFIGHWKLNELPIGSNLMAHYGYSRKRPIVINRTLNRKNLKFDDLWLPSLCPHLKK